MVVDLPPKDTATELAFQSLTKVHVKWIKRCKDEVSTKKKKSAVHET